MALITDNFDRANETPLAGNWSTVTGNSAFNLASNSITPSDLANNCAARYSAITWGNDQSSKAAITGTGSSALEGPGLAVRCASGANTMYVLIVGDSGTSNAIVIGRFIAGAFTSLAATTRTWAGGDTWEYTVHGPASAALLSAYHNGTLVQSFTDNSSIGSGSPGVFYSSISDAATINDWTGTDGVVPIADYRRFPKHWMRRGRRKAGQRDHGAI